MCISWHSKQQYYSSDNSAQALCLRGQLGVTLHPTFLVTILMGNCHGRDPMFCEMFATTSPSGGLEELIPQSEQKGRWHPDIDCIGVFGSSGG